MSSVVSAWAWRQRGLSPTLKFVLLLLADSSNHEGEVRVDKRDLAYRSELSGCEIEDALAGLCRIGLITLLAADGVATSRARYRLACEPATGGEG